MKEKIEAPVDDRSTEAQEETALFDTTDYNTSLAPLCSGLGQLHTNNPVKHGHKPYISITLDEIKQQAKTPSSTAKESAQWVIPSTLLSRVFKEQRESGLYYALWCDIDEPQDQTFDQLLTVLRGIVPNFIAYTTSGSTKDKQKARGIVPLAEPIDGQKFIHLQKIFNDKLDAGGFIPDRASERSGQVCFLPNKGEYYDYCIEEEKDLFTPNDWSVELEAEELRLKAEEEKRAEQLTISRAKTLERINSGSDSPVDAFNAEYPLALLLGQYGYQQRGAKWVSPLSQSGNAGVSISPDGQKWFSHHSSDSGIGRTGKDGGQFGDAFDLYVYFEHEGDFDSALKTFGDISGTTKANQRKYMERRSNTSPADFDDDVPRDLEPFRPECRRAWERKLAKDSSLKDIFDGNNIVNEDTEERERNDLRICKEMAWWFRKDVELMGEVSTSSGRCHNDWDDPYGDDGQAYGDFIIDGACAEQKSIRPFPVSTNDNFNSKYGLVMVGGKAVIASTKRDPNTGQPIILFYQTKDLLLLHANEFAYDKYGERIGKENTKGEFKHTPAFDYWLKSKDRRTYSDVVFKPIGGKVFSGELIDEETLNLYLGLAYTPFKSDCGLLLDHIKTIWCKGDEDAYQYILNWLARLMQKPDEQGYSAIILMSEEGAGKNTIVDIIAEALGSHASICSRSEDVTGKFNDHLALSVLVFLNEAVWGGNHSGQGTLKTLITDPTITVERKFLPKFLIRNYTHLIFSSNEDWPTALSRKDRRYIILNLDNSRANNTEYFNKIHTQIKNGGKEGFIHYLLNRDIKNFNPRDIPKINSDVRADIKTNSLGTIETWWADTIAEGIVDSSDVYFDGVNDANGSIRYEDWVKGEVTILKSVLMGHYYNYCKAMGRAKNLQTATQMGQMLVQKFGLKSKREGSGDRRTTYVIPRLKECQERIRSRMGDDVLTDYEEAEEDEF